MENDIHKCVSGLRYGGRMNHRHRSRPGPKPRLDRRMIVAAVLATGLEQVTMQSVADRLGTSASAIYRYFDGRDDMVAAAMEELLRADPVPIADRGWREFLLAEAELRWRLLSTTAGLAAARTNRMEANRMELVATQRMHRLVAGLQECGFSVDEAVLAVDAVLDLIHDGASQAASLREPSPGLRERLRSGPPDVAAALERIIADPHAHVMRKLDLVLDGLDARVRA